jgi:hypothetical protein
MDASTAARSFDWVTAIGYQHEVLHSAVLDHLLADPDVAPLAARSLLADQTLRVETVGHVACESRIGPGRRRPIDLAADLALQDGRDLRLGVEVKVDSAWSREQLESTVASGDRGVLLAVGCTALAATEAEMPTGWRLIGLLGGLPSLPSTLAGIERWVYTRSTSDARTNPTVTRESASGIVCA